MDLPPLPPPTEIVAKGLPRCAIDLGPRRLYERGHSVGRDEGFWPSESLRDRRGSAPRAAIASAQTTPPAPEWSAAVSRQNSTAPEGANTSLFSRIYAAFRARSVRPAKYDVRKATVELESLIGQARIPLARLENRRFHPDDAPRINDLIQDCQRALIMAPNTPSKRFSSRQRIQKWAKFQATALSLGEALERLKAAASLTSQGAVGISNPTPLRPVKSPALLRLSQESRCSLPLPPLATGTELSALKAEKQGHAHERTFMLYADSGQVFVGSSTARLDSSTKAKGGEAKFRIIAQLVHGGELRYYGCKEYFLDPGTIKEEGMEAARQLSLTRAHNEARRINGSVLVTKKAPLLISQFYSGGDVLAHIQQLPLKFQELLHTRAIGRRLLYDVARRLAILHAAGDAHRDVKLDNILVGSDSKFYLSDEGFRITIGLDAEKDAEFFGTPEYLPPEAYRREPYGLSVDIWTLGLAFLETSLAGNFPFGHPGKVDIRAFASEMYRSIARGSTSYSPVAAKHALADLFQHKHLEEAARHLLTKMLDEEAPLFEMVVRMFGPPEHRPLAVEIVALLEREYGFGPDDDVADMRALLIAEPYRADIARLESRARAEMAALY